MSNDSAKGFIVKALKNLGYETEKIKKILDELHYQFDIMTNEEAEQYYYSGKWQEENKN